MVQVLVNATYAVGMCVVTRKAVAMVIVPAILCMTTIVIIGIGTVLFATHCLYRLETR